MESNYSKELEEKGERLEKAESAKKDKFTIIDNSCLQDAELSLQAVGLISYLISLPSDWIVYTSQLAKRFKVGRDRMRKIIRELIDKGYIQRHQKRTRSGRLDKWVTIFSDTPIFLANSPEPDLPETDFQSPVKKNVSPALDLPAPDFPGPVNKALQNTNNTKETFIKNKQHNNKPPRSPKLPIDLAVDVSLSEPDLGKAVDETKERGISKRSTHIAKPSASSEAVMKVFEYWQATLNHRGAILDARRREKIKAALRLGYTPENLMKAIVGCSVTPFNMGDNDKGQRYDGLHVILKDADQIERFMRNADNPPRRISAADRRKAEMDAVAREFMFSDLDEITLREKEESNLLEGEIL